MIEQQPPKLTRHWLLPVLMATVLALVYSGNLDAPFIVDDVAAIQQHGDVIQGDGIVTLWSNDYWLDRAPYRNLYRPVTILSYWLNARMPGASDTIGGTLVPRPTLFRLVNVLGLFALGWLAALWMERSVAWPLAWIGAVLLIFHPSASYVVNYVVGRADLLAILGTVAFLFLQRLAFDTGGWRLWTALLALLAGVVAMGSKESGMMILPAALVQHLVLRASARQATFTAFCALIPFLLYWSARFFVLGTTLGDKDHVLGSISLNPLREMPFIERLPGALVVAWFYFTQTIWPDIAYYHSPATLPTWNDPRVWLGLLVLLVVGCAIVVLIIRKHWLAAALAVAAGQYGLVGNLLVAIGVWGANRLMLPFVFAGAAIFVAIGAFVIVKKPTRQWAVVGTGGVLALLCIVTTVAAINPVWTSEIAVAERDLAREPDNPVYQFNLASAQLGEAARLADTPRAAVLANEAVDLLEKVIASRPDATQAHYQIAGVYFRLNRFDDAIVHYGAVLERSPAYGDALIQLGAMHLIKEEPDKAEAVLVRAQAVDPNHPSVLHNLAVAATMRGDYVVALKRYQALLTEHPNHQPGLSEYRQLAGSLLQQQGK